MPPKSGLIPDERRLQASRIFVNRDKPIALFTRAALDIPAEGPKFLVFYGVGGQGKTTLCRKLIAITEDDPSLDHLRVGCVDLHGRPERDGALGMVWLRNALARGKGAKLTFPAFDIAFAHYWQATRPDQPMPSFAARWLGRHDDFASDTTAATGETAGELLQTVEGLVQDLASAAPFVGMALRRLTGWAIAKGRHEFHKRTNEALAHLFEKGEVIAPHEIERLLPLFLARDLDAYREKNENDRFVLFIDEYERVYDKGIAGALHRENPLDKAYRDFASEANGALFIFFSRERLPWAEIDPGWEEDLKDRQHLLAGLAEKDAQEFLEQSGIEDKSLREAMIEGASAEDPRTGEVTTFPIMLDLQVDHYYALGGDEKNPPRPQDFRVSAKGFAKRRNELVARFLRDYDSPLEATLKRLTPARWFDRALFAHLVKQFATGFQLDAFETFTRLSFIDEKAEEGRYAIHTLIRDAIAEITDEATIAETHDALFRFYDEASSAEDKKEMGAAHVEALAEAFHHKTFAPFEELFDWWSKKREAFENPAFARSLEPLVRQLLELTEMERGLEHPDTAACCVSLAVVLSEEGRYSDAETLHRKALEIRERVLGEEHPDTAESYNNVAFNLDAQGRLQKAERLHRKALELRVRLLGEEHPSTAVSYNNLASNLNDQGHMEEAESLHRKALDIRERVLGEEHSDTASSYNNLATCLNSQGRLQEAEPLYRKALEICVLVLGEDHPYTADGYNNIAFNLKAQGHLQEAEPLCRKALDIWERVLGEVHPATARSYNNLASNLNDQGRMQEAEPLYRKALDIWKQVFGDEHPTTAQSYNNIAYNLYSQGRLQEAEPLYRKALDIRERVFGKKHPETAQSYNNLASNLVAQGQARDAEPLFRQALEIREQVLGEQHHLTAQSNNNLAHNLDAQNRMEEAEPLHRKALEIFERQLGEEHPWTAQSYNNLACNLTARGRHEDAQPLLDKAQMVAERALAPGHPLLGRIRTNAARTLNGLGKRREAQEAIEEAISILEEGMGLEHNWTKDALALRDEIAGGK